MTSAGRYWAGLASSRLIAAACTCRAPRIAQLPATLWAAWVRLGAALAPFRKS